MIEHLFSQYLTALQAEGRTPHTLRWHRQSLKQFSEWLKNAGHPEVPNEWTPAMLRSYIVFHQTRQSARDRPLSGSALNSLVRSPRAFCAWLLAEGFVNRDLFARVRVPRAPGLVQPTLSDEGARALIAAARAGKRNGRRDAALLLFMFDPGARAGEVCGLQAGGRLGTSHRPALRQGTQGALRPVLRGHRDGDAALRHGVPARHE